jgi:lysosomal acid lipase/cholesteryl ester hydrolase
LKKFILADAGYDVWLGNNRGNTYSMTNLYYTPDEDDFWNFSWDQMASSDLSTEIDVSFFYWLRFDLRKN